MASSLYTCTVLELVAFLVLCKYDGTSALLCSVCNTVYDGSACKDKPEQFVRNCSAHPYIEAEPKYCRKASVVFWKPEIEERVYRSCGYLHSPKPCVRFLPQGGQTLQCECDSGDACNGASGLSSTVLALITTIGAVGCIHHWLHQ
ncbi:uncharacterized protein LOC135367916 [Ornithodoros turicata]|uniref:uncharacterized protein LOC135367916 n=1 Tax=Ornithodoros turicata TaxID=34597 RepID=UPI003138E27A